MKRPWVAKRNKTKWMREKVRQSKLGKKRPKSVCLAISKAHKGIKLSPEHKEKIRQWNLKHNWKPPIGKREKCSAWKGGIKISDGYILLYKPEHPMARKDGYILKHRLIMAKKLRRNLVKNEVIHHINGNRIDNQIKNLKLYKTSGKHIMKNHAKKDKTTGRFLSHNWSR